MTGAIAAFVASRAVRPVVSAAKISSALVNRIRREEIGTRIRVEGNDELVALRANINLIQNQLHEVFSRQETEAERSQLLMYITRRIHQSISKKMSSESLLKKFAQLLE